MEARGLKSLIESLAPYPPTPRRRPLRFRCLVRAVGRWMCLGYTRWYTSAPAPSTGCRARRPQCFDKLRLRSQKASSLAVVVARALRAIAGSRVRKLMQRGRSNLLLIANTLGACIATSARARATLLGGDDDGCDLATDFEPNLEPVRGTSTVCARCVHAASRASCQFRSRLLSGRFHNAGAIAPACI